MPPVPASTRGGRHSRPPFSALRLSSTSGSPRPRSLVDLVRIDPSFPPRLAPAHLAMHSAPRRHALAEIAGEFERKASVAKLERSTSDYLEHGTVVPLGRRDGESAGSSTPATWPTTWSMRTH